MLVVQISFPYYPSLDQLRYAHNEFENQAESYAQIMTKNKSVFFVKWIEKVASKWSESE